MNGLYEEDTLYIDLEGFIGRREMNHMREYIFRVSDQYEVDNIVINTNRVSRMKKRYMRQFISEYYRSYKGRVLIEK